MSNRRPIIIGNWKMHKTQAETYQFCKTLSVGMKPPADVAVAPPFTSLATAVEGLRETPVHVFAQNIHWEDKGAFTGEVSGPMLAEMGVMGALIGHSERRRYFGETDETVSKRLGAALRNRITPVICVGETLDERKAGQALAVIKRQVQACLASRTQDDASRILIAYEPVWAIGTGETATPEQAQEVHAYIRAELAGLWGANTAESVRILYGGSVTSENAATLLSQSDVDGALVGGASLQPENFAKIVHFR